MNMRLLGRTILGIQLVILIGIVFHAPLSVWLGTVFPASEAFIKAWKEILMGVCMALIIVSISRARLWRELIADWVVRLAAAYAAVHALLLTWMPQGVVSASAGLLIDLRYILFFVLVYVTARFIPIENYRRNVLRAAGIGAAIVIGFAALQVLILPDNILSYIGYSKQTITPFLTVDLNEAYVRINSTLRGPNPLGAYAGMCLALTVAYVVQRRNALSSRQTSGAGLLALGSISAMWASYSRSAVAAGIGMVLIVAALATVKRFSRRSWIVSSVVLFALVGGIIAARDTAFVSNIVLHENPAGGSAEKSNDGHVDSLYDGTMRMLRQPLGGGIGSTGSASIRGSDPLIIENQYLFIAHEVGWVGLGLFIALFGYILWLLFKRRRDWLALGLFASGIGLAGIGLLLPVWVDDTVSIIWWGLAGLAVATKGISDAKKRSRNKKAA
jgi:hypothetical protein